MFPSQLEGDTLFCPVRRLSTVTLCFCSLSYKPFDTETLNLIGLQWVKVQDHRAKIWKLFLLINILLTIYHRKTYISCDGWSAWVQDPCCFVVSGSNVMVSGSSSRWKGLKMLICFRSLSHNMFVTETSYIMRWFSSGQWVKGKGRKGKW